jgi:NAD(P)-dependent dehydrogenase (short-subunit alcohol dehydrogenase family)
VVFTGETHGAQPRAYWGAFAVSKAGLSTLAAIWGDELEHAGNPRINVLIPGPIASPQRLRSHPGEDRARLARPEASASAFLYLLGPAARALNGRTFEL